MKILTTIILCFYSVGLYAQTLDNNIIDGYRGIWFTLNQFTEYGDKYSGGLGTYTVKHVPLAIYSAEAGKTFFVYGGTTSENERHLLCMIGYYDHKSGTVCKPRVVFDKQEVDDPHDNPSLLIDKDGYIWVFVSGRNISRPGYKYRSTRPYSIDSFERMGTSDMTYPQPMYIDGHGFFHFFTQYTGVRELYFETSTDGINWSAKTKLAGMKGTGETRAGHYQVSNHRGSRIVTFFNRHPDGNVDKRTNIYFIQTDDFGRTWSSVSGEPVDLPVTDPAGRTLVLEVESKGKNVYIKDVNFDQNGHPMVLYLTSNSHKPGPDGNPREWHVTRWDGIQWVHSYITTSTHNYDSGSLWVNGKEWVVIAPTLPGPQYWGTGGEIVSWVSRNQGNTWKMKHQYTTRSIRNQGYVRRPVNARDPFYSYWADGNTDKLSISKLYFGDSKGNVYELPYHMKDDMAKPVKIKQTSK